MALTNQDQATIRQYLLGHLSEEEQQKIEERLMTEDELAEELEITTGELIEEYYSGELNQDDRSWFARHYLASPEGRQRYTFTVALNCLKRPLPAPQHLSLLERLESFFNKHRWEVATATAVVLIAVIVFVWVLRYKPQSAVSITVVNTATVRGSEDNDPPPVRVALPSNATELRALLPLPTTSAPNVQRYRAELDNRTEKKTVKVAEHNNNSVVVVIPAAELPRGIYELTLTAIQVDGMEQAVPGSYRFNVE